MSLRPDDKIYTAKDIEAYLSGKLTPAERHAMEKAALDDPFLAEAIEGFHQVPVDEWKPGLEALHKQLQEGGFQAKVIPMRRDGFRKMKAAAAVLLILCGAALTYVLTRNRQENPERESIAQVRPVSTASDSATSSLNNNLTQATEKDNNTGTKQPVPDAAKETYAVTKPGNAANDLKSGAETAPVLADKEKNLAATTVTPAPVNVAPVASGNITPAAPGGREVNNEAGLAVTKPEPLKKAKDESNALKQQALNRVFRAQVVGPDNSPLPFSNINIKTENFGTYADVKGNFRLVAADSLLTVEVRSVGYEPATYTLNSNQALNRIMLAETSIGKSTAVRSKAASNAESPFPALRKLSVVRDTITTAEPADGWENYNTYITNNLELPDDLIRSGKHGEISISFDVNPDGKVANVVANPSSCGDCKELARQVVEQGPQWKLKKGGKGKATIRVRY